MAYSIEAARLSGLFEKIIVSTDSPEIAAIAEEYGAESEIRPAKLSNDIAPIIEVVKHVARDHNGTVALLYAASPMMDRDVLKDACFHFESGDLTRPLLSITKEEDGRFYDAGMFCFYDSKHIRRENFRFYRVTGMDINTPEDWERCSANFERTKK